MTAFSTLETIAARLPHGFDHVMADRNAARPSLFGRITGFFSDLRERHATLSALNAMTDRELSDVGLSRRDIPRVFDGGFAQDYERTRLARAR